MEMLYYISDQTERKEFVLDHNKWFCCCFMLLYYKIKYSFELNSSVKKVLLNLSCTMIYNIESAMATYYNLSDPKECATEHLFDEITSWNLGIMTSGCYAFRIYTKLEVLDTLIFFLKWKHFDSLFVSNMIYR